MTNKGEGKSQVSALTKGDAAKLVRRTVAKMENGKPVLGKDGNPVAVESTVAESEVHAFADYGDHVVVVTTSGEKLRGEKK